MTTLRSDTEAYRHCLERLSKHPRAGLGLQKLQERGSLTYLGAEGFEHLTPTLVEWLLRAESHAGTELLYRTPDHKVRGLPLNSFFNFPERYAARMPHGVFISAELEGGSSMVLFLSICSRDSLLTLLESAQQNLPLTTDRPLRERILEKLRQTGHLSYLSRDGLDHLTGKLVKYLDYAVNLRPGSEIIYFNDKGHVQGDALEKVLQKPEKFAKVARPVYLAIEVDEHSVLFDTQDVSPSNIWRLQKKARQIVAQHTAGASR